MAYSSDPTRNDGNPGAGFRVIEIRKIQKATEHLLSI